MGKVEEALKKIDSDNAKTMSSLVQMVHTTANTLRHDAARSAGTPLAQKVDESSLTVALMEMSGLSGLAERLGLVTKDAEEVDEGSQTVSDDTQVVTPAEEIS